MEKKLQLGPENLLLKKTIKRSHFFNKHIHLQNGIYFMMNFPVAILVGRSVYNSLVFSMYSPSIDAWLTYATCLWHQGVCFACLPSGRVTWQWNIPHVQGGNNKHLDDSWSKCSFYEYHSPNFGNFDWTLQQFGTCVTLNPRVQAGLVDQGSLYYKPKQCIVKKGNPSKLPWMSIVWFPEFSGPFDLMT